VHRFEGEMNFFSPAIPGCMHCFWSKHKAPELDVAGNCAAAPVFAPAVGVLGVMQAAEALKFILGLQSSRDTSNTRLINLLDGSAQSIERMADPACPVCGRPGTEKVVQKSETGSVVILQPEELAALGALQTVALLEPGESFVRDATSARVVSIPVGDLLQLRELAAKRPTLLVCRSGVRSAALARLLRAEGVDQIFALAGRTAAIRLD
jgi:sulfur-carrier protein adenylyltransferase/sulfurtransferase